MKIRNADIEDIPKLLELAKLMHSESRYSKFDYDSEKVKLLLTNLIQSDEGIVLVLSDLSGGLVGCVAEHFFGHDKTAADFALFVHPEQRGMSAFGLIKEYTKQAKRLGAKDIVLSTSTNYMPKSVGRLYEKMGFSEVGAIYCLENNNV